MVSVFTGTKLSPLQFGQVPLIGLASPFGSIETGRKLPQSWHVPRPFVAVDLAISATIMRYVNTEQKRTGISPRLQCDRHTVWGLCFGSPHAGRESSTARAPTAYTSVPVLRRAYRPVCGSSPLLTSISTPHRPSAIFRRASSHIPSYEDESDKNEQDGSP